MTFARSPRTGRDDVWRFSPDLRYSEADGCVLGKGRCQRMKKGDWEIPVNLQPNPDDYAFDLERSAEGGGGDQRQRSLRCVHRRDARHRAGRQRRRHPRGRPGADHRLSHHRGRDGLAHLSDGRAVPGHVLAYDQETGFGLVQALARLDLPALDDRQLGRGRGRRARRVRRRPAAGTTSVAARIVAQAGVRRLLGIRARRGDLHRAGASQLGRHGADRRRRRAARHRLAATAAGRRARAGAATSTWSCRSTC